MFEMSEYLPSTIGHPCRILLRQNTVPFPRRRSRECTSLYLNTDQGRLARSTVVKENTNYFVQLYV